MAAGDSRPGTGRAAVPAACAVAACSGAAVLALEVTGARLFMPFFGSSVVVWSNLIGVTLASVAIGTLAGGRIADGTRRHATVLAALLLLAGAAIAPAPWLVPRLALHYLPADLPLEAAFGLLARASLVVALVAFGPALLLLGAATPVLVRRLCEERPVGRSVGWVSGFGTLGSLAGTWLPVHLLVPQFGSRFTLLLCSALLALAALIAALLLGGGRRARVVAGLGLAVALGLAAGTAGLAGGALRVGPATIAELETPYQYARVDDDGAMVHLRLNEGLDSFHSLMPHAGLLTGAYYDVYSLLLPPPGSEGEASPVAPGRSVLILGFAAGTIARQLLGWHDRPDLRLVGVELDPAVVSLGAQHFDMPRGDPRLTVVAGQDGRIFLERTEERFDLIVVDAYAQQVYVPFHLCSREFFARAHARLTPRGVLAANLSAFTPADLPLRAIANTAAAVFGDVALLRVEGGRNFVLLARRGGPPPDPRGLPAAPAPELEPILAAARGALAWRRQGYDPDGLVLTDDRSPIEQLADRDLLERSRRLLEAVTDGGERAP